MARWAGFLVAAGSGVCAISVPAAARGAPVPTAATADCAPVTVGPDTSLWNTTRSCILGKAVVQTFLAPDTLISRITVWRPPWDIDALGTHLFVTAVDTTRTPPWPDARAILLDGPTVLVRGGVPEVLTEMSFVIDPPLALPRPGIYAFFLQRAGCDDGETTLIANDANAYPYGMRWATGRTSGSGGCWLPGAYQVEENIDLIFRIEFCSEGATPVRPMSWGRLKAIYR